MRTEMRVRGQGGQGAITIGYVMARAFCIYMDRGALLTEAYGPEITGGFARADVVFDDDNDINYPLVSKPDILIVMSREAWEAERENVGEDTLVIYESRMCNISDEEKNVGRFVGVPALQMALDLKAKVVMNVILMAITTELTEIVTKEALEKAVFDRVPGRFRELNEKALKSGYEFAKGLKVEA